MREILFRGKREDNGEWVEGFFVLIPCGRLSRVEHIIQTVNRNGKIGRLFDVIPETVGQLTGLTDKSGKKIFEGDIVAVESHGYIPDKFIGEVVFRDGCYGIQYTFDFYGIIENFHRIGQVDKWQDMGASGTVTYTYEIVGNIHDNPELITQEA